MDYEKKYKETIAWIDTIMSTLTKEQQEDALEIFPELTESEDERIRNEIIDYLSTADDKELIPYESWIAWLEKQDKKLPVGFYYVNSKGEKFYSDTFKYGDVILHVEKQCDQKSQRMISAEAKEAMYDKPANKVEPKFNVGDWVVYYRNDSSREVLQVYDIRDGRYYFTDNVHFSWSVKECDEKSHLWTIQDAKDGDVIINDFHLIFIFKEIKNNTCISHCSIIDRGNDVIVNSLAEKEVGDVNLVKCHPATKEQCDLLFQKMKEGGYEWDAEKKDKRRIEQNSDSYCREHCKGFQETGKCFADGDCKAKKEAEQEFINKVESKCEENKTRIYDALTSFEDRLFAFIAGCEFLTLSAKIEFIKKHSQELLDVAKKQIENEEIKWSEEEEVKINRIVACLENLKVADNDILLKDVEWLKSLKARYTWKPSDEQIRALDNARHSNPFDVHILDTLFHDLKKLK